MTVVSYDALSMSPDELERKVGLITSQYEGAAPYQPPPGPPRLVGIPDRTLAPRGSLTLDSEQLRLLKVLYGQAGPELQAQFGGALLAQLDERTAPLIVHALYELGKLSELTEALRSRESGLEIRKAVWRAIGDKLAVEHFRFGEPDLDLIDRARAGEDARLRAWPRPPGVPEYRDSSTGELTPTAWDLKLEGVRATVERARMLLERVRYERLKGELLEAGNPEINTDKEMLVSRMEALGFRKAIVEALREVDRRLQAAGTALDFKGCMDLVRTVFEEVLEDAARTVTKKREISLPLDPPRKHFQPWVQLLENNGILNGDESALAHKLYNFASNTGSHALGSAPEQARVAKNMVIEFCLMVVGRVQAPT